MKRAGGSSEDNILRFRVKRHINEEIIRMKQTRHGYPVFRIESGGAKIVMDPFRSDNPSTANGWSGYLTGKNSTHGGER